jgi:hypothetical protein
MQKKASWLVADYFALNKPCAQFFLCFGVQKGYLYLYQWGGEILWKKKHWTKPFCWLI